MARIEETPNTLVLTEGATTLTLDKAARRAKLQQKVLFWSKKPVEFGFSDIEDIAVTSVKDAMSGAPIHHSILRRRTGEVTALTTGEAADAEATVQRLRSFVGM
jgi:hypothetical protein